MSRREPVVVFTERVEPGPLRRVIDVLQALFGKVESLVDVALLLETAGHTVTAAATDPGTAITTTRTVVDFEDAGIDSVRAIVRGKNNNASAITVQVYDVTQGRAIATATITGTSEQTAKSGWQVFRPAGGDEEIEVRVVGNGIDSPVLYAVHLQGRTTQARA